ncbi:nucleoredoxin-like [Argonauta hians]
MAAIENLLGSHVLSCKDVSTDNTIPASTSSDESTGDGPDRSCPPLLPVKDIIGKDKIIGLLFAILPDSYREEDGGLSSASTSSSSTVAPAGCVLGTPQHAFNTVLRFYKDFKQNSPLRDNLEIIYVSTDTSFDTLNWPLYQKYLADMPWMALPLQDRQRQKALIKKYHVLRVPIPRVPMLVLIDTESGKVITKNGISCIEDDPRGEMFPWRPSPFKEVIRGKLLTNNSDDETFGYVDALTQLQGKITGLYFSAHWCPPCKHFTPVLSAMYDKLKSEGQNFEVVFVSSDRSNVSFEQYFRTMPWLAIPYNDSRTHCLKSAYDVYGIPTLIIIDENGKVITKDGRVAINADLQGQEFPWYVKALNELTDSTAASLNEGPCLILLTDGNKSEMESARNILKDLAEKEHQREDQRLLFFYGGEDEICDFFRDYAALEDRNPLLVITDFPEEKIFVCSETSITSEVAASFLDDYFSGCLPAEPLLLDS